MEHEIDVQKLIEDQSINKYDLVEEWSKNGALVSNVAVLLADAIKDRDDAKDQLAKVKAEAMKDVATNPNEYDLPKNTDLMVRNEVDLVPEVIEAKEAYNKANWVANTLEGMMSAYIQRKEALVWMTKLFFSEYYSEPNPELLGPIDKAKVDSCGTQEMMDMLSKNERVSRRKKLKEDENG